MKITAIIPTKNEAHNIERCLKSLAWCDHIIVIDVGNDKTAEIAQKMGAEVVTQEMIDKSSKDTAFVALQKNINWAIEHAKTEWILRIDADEEVTPELEKEIKNIIEKRSEIAAYGVKRNQYFMGGFLKGGDWAYDRLIRLFKKDSAKYDTIVQVHEQFKVKGEIGYLEQPLNHYSHPTLQIARDKFQAYTTVQVKDMSESLPQAFFNLIFQPPYIFLRWMIWHKGYIDGFKGVVAAAYRGWYEFLLYSKYISYKLK